eukprot:TRINITY_DN690_c0_g2_i1.p1 TRINITY_DN690_c0_g2~~TRINITY_DN690_c0_g2_i1.p1  ORF type:complete len:277 (+),score=47.34 TRINITY_DN690_c0_g2_i1:304-1134(+)
MYPLDVVKTRLQLQVTKQAATAVATGVEPVLYTSVFGCFKHIIKTEGVGRLYRGIASPILAEAPKRAVKFSTNETYKSLFSFIPDAQLRAVAAGASAGITEAFVNCPFEVVKVRMQARQSDYKNTMDAATRILRNEGLGGIYSGLLPQVLRNAVWNGAYFGVIFKLKSVLWTPQSENSELARNFVSGLVGGAIATTANTPLDVVKSRMQNLKAAGSAAGDPSPTILGTLVKIYKEEGGVKALWKGYIPRIYRLGPGGGIMIVAYDWIAKRITRYNE